MGQLRSHLSTTIGIDATYSVGSALSGVGRYSVELIRALKTGYPQIQWNLYYRPHRFLRAPWPKGLLFEATPRSCRLFHGLNQRLPKRTQISAISTFHDLFVLSAEYSSPDFRRRFEEQARHAAAKSDHIIAVSQFTADQVAEYLGFPRDRIHVVPHGVHQEEYVPSIEARQPAILTVGAVQKRKNTARLIEAFGALPAPWELWIAGSLGFEAEAMLKAAKTSPRIRLLGYVPDSELRRLYQEASVFAFPSLDEGFGMPVLEAMAHGLPVLTSNRSSLPEVAGDAALLVDPFKTEAIAEGLRQLTGIALRNQLATRGFHHIRAFTWERAAKQSAAVYAKCLGISLS
jgi:glycosyltransferase involved in cell wall biosynthesis